MVILKSKYSNQAINLEYFVLSNKALLSSVLSVKIFKRVVALISGSILGGFAFAMAVAAPVFYIYKGGISLFWSVYSPFNFATWFAIGIITVPFALIYHWSTSGSGRWNYVLKNESNNWGAWVDDSYAASEQLLGWVIIAVTFAASLAVACLGSDGICFDSEGIPKVIGRAAGLVVFPVIFYGICAGLTQVILKREIRAFGSMVSFFTAWCILVIYEIFPP